MEDIHIYINDLINKKKNLIGETDEQLQLIEDFIKIPNAFFKINIDVALQMLKYIDVPDEKLYDVYFQIVAPKNFENQNIIISNDYEQSSKINS